jgi:uncharacterized protein
LSGRLVTVITGASSGIGAAAARRLAREPGARLVLVARSEDRLRALAHELGGEVSWLALDLLLQDAPDRVRAHLEAHHDGALDLLVNNAGSSWRAPFADGGWPNVQRHMALNLDAVLRLTQALLPLLRASAPSSIVNVSSVAGRVGRGGAGGYSASKFALAGWSDALYAEERPHGVHVGLVLPGFVKTEGFPAAELTARRTTRWLVSTPEKVADAIMEAGPGGRAERYVPRGWALVPVARVLLPGLLRRLAAGGAGKMMVTKTGAEAKTPPETG